MVLEPEADPESFRAAMSAFHVGDTIKITKSDRHGRADALALDNLDLSDADIVDVGASDGTTSVELVSKLRDFSSYTIADLYLTVTGRRAGRWAAFYDSSGEPILLVGRRLVAWPGLSRPVARLARPVLRRLAERADAEEVLLLNPATRALLAADPRVGYRVHDVFEVYDGPPPDLIKVANLLRRLYFSDADIERGLRALLGSLPDGGHLLLVDNPRIAGIDERAGLYRRTGDRFELVAQTEHPTEVDDLVRAVRSAVATTPDR